MAKIRNKNRGAADRRNDFSASAAPDSASDGHAWRMSFAPTIDTPVVGFQLLPAVVFAAVVILFVHMHRYTRNMGEFYWSGGNNSIVDFFSYTKVVWIVICASLALLMLLYRLVTQSLAIKSSVLYYPMAVYMLFVLLSFAFSSQKFYAWYGWNDRFEGTLTIICYMVMLFYFINSINSEINVKWIIYPVAASSGLLSLLGLSQFLNHDFFRTALGQKLLVPSVLDGTKYWEKIDEAAARGEQLLNFTFKNREIYQTVYNINYVSFYLTLLIPLFGMLFIREKRPVAKTIWGALMVLILINLIGSASSGGVLGMFFVVLMAIAVLNKRLLKWWKPVSVLLCLTVLVAAGTHVYMSKYTGRSWMDEIGGAVSGALRHSNAAAVPATPASSASAGDEASLAKPRLDYFINDGFDIIFSVNGNRATITTSAEDPSAFTLRDDAGAEIPLEEAQIQFDKTEGAAPNPGFLAKDPRFSTIQLIPANSANEDSGAESFNYCIFKLADEDSMNWPFAILDNGRYKGTYYHNQLGNFVKLTDVPSFGWENNPAFGSGRGYIWSRTLPMLSQTLFVGHGADTYCIYYPQNDYVGKYNSSWNINTIVDKPHNMYLAAGVGTGVISVLALLALFVLYFIQSVRIYWREEYEDFTSVVGAGTFFGVFGFAVSGFVDDST
ncbi:MAG: O-antigen ligase family protein, partial [Clostridiales Family XIII bacterium]|nr:O-antigen ligase family protein [Clostridiales Family XIII bacterium]